MLRHFLLITITLLCQPSLGNPTEIPKSIDNCGSRFVQFRKYFRELGLAEHSAQVFTDYAMESFMYKHKNASPKEIATLRNLLNTSLMSKVSAEGGYIDLASCYFSVNGMQNFDFENFAKTYNEVIASTRSEMGTQHLNWIASDWCNRNWDSIFSEVQIKAKLPIHNFRPLLLCK
jgi:hypothetical protein